MAPTFDINSLASPVLSKIVKRLLIFIIIGLLGNIIFALWTCSQSLLHTAVQFNVWYLLAALVLTLLPWLLHAWRIIIWSDFVKKRISFKQSLKIVLGTELGAAISPSAIGGGPVKAAMLMQHNMSGGVATSITALGSVEDNVVIAVLVPVALTVSGSWQLPIVSQLAVQVLPIVMLIGAGLAGLLGAILLIHRFKEKIHFPQFVITLYESRWVGRIVGYIRSFWVEFKSVYLLIGTRGRRRLAASMLITSVQWICKYSVITVLLAGMDMPVQPAQLFALQWIVFSMTVFIPTPGGAAGAEAAFLLVHHHVVQANLLNVSMLFWRFYTFYLLLILGIVLLIILNMPRPTLPGPRRRPVVKPAALNPESL